MDVQHHLFQEDTKVVCQHDNGRPDRVSPKGTHGQMFQREPVLGFPDMLFTAAPVVVKLNKQGVRKFAVGGGGKVGEVICFQYVPCVCCIFRFLFFCLFQLSLFFSDNDHPKALFCFFHGMDDRGHLLAGDLMSILSSKRLPVCFFDGGNEFDNGSVHFPTDGKGDVMGFAGVDDFCLVSG